CTITNTRNVGTIKVIKDVVPNDNGATGWDFGIVGPTNNNASNLHDGDGSTAFVSATGGYTITETAHSGTTLGNYITAYSCHAGEAIVASGSGTVAQFSLPTNANVVCTFTNTIKNGSLTVKKVMVGGTDTFNFTGDVAGNISQDGGSLTV